jgi:hypothetical protein
MASFEAVDLKDSVSSVCLLKSRISPSRYVVMEDVLVKGADVLSRELLLRRDW